MAQNRACVCDAYKRLVRDARSVVVLLVPGEMTVESIGSSRRAWSCEASSCSTPTIPPTGERTAC
jgi:hypothetical protein